MVTPEFTRRALAAGRPPRSRLAEIPGAGHQLFLDDLAATIGPLTEWAEAALEPRPLAA
jgi:pimeloyl-ACP methyl ester carboxylesterase